MTRDSFEEGALPAAAPPPPLEGRSTFSTGDGGERSGSRDLDSSSPALQPAPLVQPRRKRSVWRSPYFRRGVQAACGTAFICAVFVSIPPLFHALSLDPSFANSSIILVLYFMVLLVSLATGEAPIMVGADALAGSLFGGALGIGALYLIAAMNGGSLEPGVGKAAALLCVSAVVMFVLTCLRFSRMPRTLLWQFASLTFAIPTAGSYYKTDQPWRFTLLWCAYTAIGAVVALVCATIILPTTAGDLVRRRLAAGLERSCDILRRTLDLASGDVDPATGLLTAASGETAERIGLDSGLHPQLMPTYAVVEAAGQALQEAYRHLGHAPLHWNAYRRQHILPARPWSLEVTLGRGLLNSVMMCLYPVQTGRQRCTLIARHRAPLLAFAAALDACCCGVGDAFVQNAPVSEVLAQLRGVEASFVALVSAARLGAGHAALTQDVLALDALLSLLFTAATRVRRMVLLLPEALGKDQPGARELVLAYFSADAAAAWNFDAVARLPLQRADSGGSIELLRASLLAAQPRRSLSRAALDALAPPDVQKLAAPAPVAGGMGQRWMAWLQQHTGVGPRHLALALQLVVAFDFVLLLLVIPSVMAAFGNSLQWAIFVVVSVIEPSTGGAIFKGLQRLVGTVLAGALGAACQELVYAILGNYANSAAKFATMTVLLSLLEGLLAAAAVRFPRYSYVFIISCIMLALTALPGIQTDTPLPEVALWRTVATALGVAVEMVAVTLIFPVTARHAALRCAALQLFADTMSGTLDKMAGVARTAFHSLLSPHHHTVSRRASLAGPHGAGNGRQAAAAVEGEQEAPGEAAEEQQQGQQEQQEQQQQPHLAIEMQQRHGSQQALLSGDERPQLAPVRTQQRSSAAEQQQLEVQLAGGSPQAGSWTQGRPLSPSSSSLRRRHSGGAAASPVRLSAGSLQEEAQEEEEEEEEAAALSRTVSVAASDLTEYAVKRGATFKARLIMGTSYARLLPSALEANRSIVAMLQLSLALHYEWAPFQAQHRFPFEPAFRAQRLCRHLLNVLAGLAILQDSHEIVALPMLEPHVDQVRRFAEQAAACLQGLAAMVRGRVPPDRAVALVQATGDHAQRLLLAVLSADHPDPLLGAADVANGLAVLAACASTSYVLRLLAVALVRGFHPGDASTSALLEEPTRWAIDERQAQLVSGILGVALATSAAASGGHTPRPLSPRAWAAAGQSPRPLSPRGATPRRGSIGQEPG